MRATTSLQTCSTHLNIWAFSNSTRNASAARIAANVGIWSSAKHPYPWLTAPSGVCVFFPSFFAPRQVIREKCIGFVLGENRSSYTQRDCIIYALGVGCSQDPLNDTELPYTYEQHADNFRIIPSIATTFPAFERLMEGLEKCPGLPDFNPMMLLHGQQKVMLCQPLEDTIPNLVTRAVIKDVEDKKSGAVITIDCDSTCEKTGTLICRNECKLFIRGIGNFSSEGKSEKTSKEEPKARLRTQRSSVSFQGAPAYTFTVKTPENLALIYRLSGDTNPLHADKQMAALGGFKRPILHGLCTFGIATRAIIHALLENDPTRVLSVSGRFSAAVTPGDELGVQMWPRKGASSESGGDEILFNVINKTKDDQVCLEQGVLIVRNPGVHVSRL
ncbi:MaoC family domain-containing protein [Besnoitia besnoiti]|uniref:MaoC family domain-containing protein n=1 Tax=Besnoitia besnoiti TaxID=94643 RepID=A0A2A9M7J1_BESBE|nr:MaoC family domain-containing protein [Besnoitia besnoiti]PFH33154.1 MaoC family domain-containing protein [Besnoitia besnoiti]